MALGDILGRLISRPRVAFKWSEPGFALAALRADRRVVWLFAAAMSLAGFSIPFLTREPPNRMWGLGVFAGLFAPVLVFLCAKEWSQVSVTEEYVLRERSSIAGNMLHWERRTWPFPDIERCIIVPWDASGKRFSTMIVTTEDDIGTLAVPRKIDPRQLGQYLAGRGVQVTYLDAVPKAARLPPSFPNWLVYGSVGVAALLVLLGPILRLHPFGPPAAGPPQPGPEPARGQFAWPVVPQGAAPAPGVPPFPGQFGNPGVNPAQGFDVARGVPGPAIGVGPGGMGPERFGPGLGPGPRGFDPPRLAVPRPVQPALAPPAVPMARSGRATELAGGSGGAAFESAGSGDPVLGFDYRTGSWAGQQALAELRPVFNRGAQGAPGMLTQQVLAREGYAVGALEVDAGEYVNAVRVVFVRIDAQGRLDPKDSYKSEWIGAPSGRPTRTLGGDGSKIIGVCGRRAAILDAVGLVLEAK